MDFLFFLVTSVVLFNIGPVTPNRINGLFDSVTKPRQIPMTIRTNISFLPAIVSTSTRMHGEFLRLLFLQAHRETEAHFTAVGMSSQNINTEALRFKRAAFYNGLKSKVGLAAAKVAALLVNLNVQGCSIVAPPMHAPSRTPLLLPLLLSHNLPTPGVRYYGA